MNDWRKNRNFRKYKNADGSSTYIITIDSEKLEVNEDIYKAYAESGYKMENMEALKSDRVLKDTNGKAIRDEHGNAIMLPEREVSLDKLIEENWDFLSTAPSPEAIFFSGEKSETTELHRCIALLDADERTLIKALYFEGMTERAYSLKTGIPQKTINDRKRRAIGKLKKLFQK